MLKGNGGNDVFLFSNEDFRGGGKTTDVIADYAKGDHIVDLTGELRVADSGRVDGFGRGTLLEHRDTGDSVFVEDAILRQRDILTSYAMPDQSGGGQDNNGGEGGRGAGAVTFSQKTDLYDLTIERASAFFDGTNNVEVYQVFLENKGGTPISNLDELEIRIAGGGKLDIVNADNATYRDGWFQPGSGIVGGGDNGRVFGFQVLNRPGSIDIDDRSLRAPDFEPRGPNGHKIPDEAGFKLTIRDVEPFPGGISQEVFIRNVGGTTLHDLDNLEFHFDGKLGHVSSTWGVDYFNHTFAVNPWDDGADHSDLRPGEKTKLFGFTFEPGQGSPDPATIVDAADFHLISNFNDLLS